MAWPVSAWQGVRVRHGVSKQSHTGSPSLPPTPQLIKTAELDPSRNYIAGFHPHGVLAAGAFLNLCTESTGFSSLFPGLRPHLMMLTLWFRAPFFRDYIMSGGESAHWGCGREGRWVQPLSASQEPSGRRRLDAGQTSYRTERPGRLARGEGAREQQVEQAVVVRGRPLRPRMAVCFWFGHTLVPFPQGW